MIVRIIGTVRMAFLPYLSERLPNSGIITSVPTPIICTKSWVFYFYIRRKKIYIYIYIYITPYKKLTHLLLKNFKIMNLRFLFIYCV